MKLERMAAFLLLALSSSFALALGNCSKSEQSIGGVAVGATEAQLISVFGEPLDRPALGSSEALFDTKFVYADATAYFLSGKLENLESFRKNVCTPHKICPGTPEATVRHIFGPELDESEPEGDWLSCFNTVNACSIVALLHKGKTAGLRLQCQP